MEYGNFGYVDELTGAGWQAKRTNMEKEIPLRHWHQNDPGVVPNLLNTGAGSPTGITVYETNSQAAALGGALPAAPQGGGLVIHCDAGPSVVRCYVTAPDGAGYKVTKTVNILDGSKKNQWFRPVDPRVAPDGSLFVSDWYDPGVGGHQQGDRNRGRIFRVAPRKHPSPSGRGAGGEGVPYTVPKHNFDTIDGNIEALKSPNSATRHIAWTNLHKEGAKAESALAKMYESKVPHERARALWLLGRIEGKEQYHHGKAIQDDDARMRVVAIRLARQLKRDPMPFAPVMAWSVTKSGLSRLKKGDIDELTQYLASFSSVKREAAIALRLQKGPTATKRWAELAIYHQGSDRWYLEALGIGADGNWQSALDAYLEQHADTLAVLKVQMPDNPELERHFSEGKRDIIWRSRAAKTPVLLSEIIAEKDTTAGDLPRMFRAFDFQKDSDIKTEALVKLAFGNYPEDRRNLITSEALARLKNFDIDKNPKHAAALDKVLDSAKGTPAFVEMVGKFNVSKRYPELLALAQKQPTEQLGVDAIRTLLDKDQMKLIQTGLESTDKVAAANTAQAIAGAQHDKANALLLPIVLDPKLDLELRRQATRTVARTKSGVSELVKLAKEKKISDDVKYAAGGAISTLPWPEVRMQAFGVFPVHTNKANLPLIPITDLVKQRGNSENGKIVFAKQGTCAKCHQVNGEGKNVGPDLSEIGKKFAHEAMYESILYPSASIAHNYETWVIETKKGTSASGVLVSKSDTEIAIKDAEAIVRTFKLADVESATRSPISLMPADLHQLMRTQELVDVVEYLLTLREAKSRGK